MTHIQDPSFELNGMAASWDLEPSKKVRVLLGEEDVLRPVFWIKLAKDASVYLSVRYENVLTAGEGEALTDSTGKTTIRYSELGRSPISSLKGGRASFHGSGVVNLGDRRLRRPPLRDLSRQEVLCYILFERIDRFPIVADRRKRDIRLSYTMDPDRPLFARVFAAPLGQAHIVPARDMTRQTHLVFDCAAANLSVRVEIGQGSSGIWPPASYIAVRASAPEARGD